MHEFVFCLVLRVTNADAHRVRHAVNALGSLDAFELKALASARAAGGRDARGDELATFIETGFRQAGIERAAARRGVVALCLAARDLERAFDGKLQSFLRKHGEAMVKELARAVASTGLSEEDRQLVATHWLQNCAELPIPLADPATEAFSRELGISRAELVRAADELGVNVAIVDDLIQAEIAPLGAFFDLATEVVPAPEPAKRARRAARAR